MMGLIKAIGVAIAATLLGSLIVALGTMAYQTSIGADSGATMATIMARLPALLGPNFVISLIEMLVILLPASLVLGKSSREPAWAYILVGAVPLALLGLLPFASADRAAVMALFAAYGASTGLLYWLAFRRRRPAATPTVT
jgi:hypothetical protein